MFKKATRTQVKLKLEIAGPSGSGKTKSALRLATGLGGKIAVIDTENGSSSLYANEFEFDVCELSPPFTTESYVNAINVAEKEYDIIIIDSTSHQWAGEGGLLEVKGQLDTRQGSNQYTNWAPVTKKHESFKSAMLHSTSHIIATVRSKQEYVLTEDKGKQVPKKVGLAPIQRDGLEYEFTVVFDIAMDHMAQASKDRTGMFADHIFQVTEETGKKLKVWLESGDKAQPPQPKPIAKDPPALEQTQLPEDKPNLKAVPSVSGVQTTFQGPPPFQSKYKLSDKQIYRLEAIAGKAGIPKHRVVETVQARYGCLPSEMSKADYDKICTELEQTSAIPSSTGGASK